MQTPADTVTHRFSGAATRGALLAALAVIFVWTAPAPALDGIERGARWLRDGDDTAGRAIVTTVLVAAAALGYVLAWARATSLRRPVRVGGGRGTITPEELGRRVREAVLELSDVEEARVRVENLHRRGVRVSLRLDVTPDARLGQTAATAAARVEETLAQRAGVALAEPPSIEIRYEELILAGSDRRTRQGASSESDAA